MGQVVPAVIVAVAVGIALVSVTIRLRLFDRTTAAGRLLLFLGGLMLFLSTCWQVARATSAYPSWFIDDAYVAIDWGQAAFSIVGLILLAVGISRFVQHWQFRTEEAMGKEPEWRLKY